MRAQTGHSTDGGIYEIVSPSGKRYIGSAAIFRSRWYQHKKELRDGTHHCPPLQRAWNKYGEADFVFRILEIIEEPTRAKLLEREQWWLDALRPDYNVAKLAGSVFGLRWKVSKPRSPEHLAKLSAARRLRAISDETRAKVAQTNIIRGAVSRLLTPEARAASLEASHARKGIPTGRVYADEQRERIAASNKAARANWTPEQHEAWRLKHVGQKRTAEAKAKMSAAKKGKPSTKRADPSRCAKGLHEWVEGQKKGCRECNRLTKSAWDAKRKREAPAAT